MIRVFKRKPWRRNPSWPDGYEPNASARKTTVCHVNTEREAVELCTDHNRKRPDSGKGYYEFTYLEWEAA